MERMMKQYVGVVCLGIFLAFLLMLPSTVDAAKRMKHVVDVSSVEELMDALADDTEIVLAPGRYNISEWSRGSHAKQLIKPFAYNMYSPAGIYSSYDMELAGFKNITIRGRDTEAITAEIVIEEPYDTVLKFRSCQNLTLANISVGHIVKKGTCSGAVLGFNESNHIMIQNADLYGCGTYGYEADHCNNIAVYDSVIRECTYGLISAKDSTNLRFIRTTFKDTKTDLALMWLTRSQIELDDCIFQNVYGPMDGLYVDKGLNMSNKTW